MTQLLPRRLSRWSESEIISFRCQKRVLCRSSSILNKHASDKNCLECLTFTAAHHDGQPCGLVLALFFLDNDHHDCPREYPRTFPSQRNRRYPKELEVWFASSQISKGRFQGRTANNYTTLPRPCGYSTFPENPRFDCFGMPGAQMGQRPRYTACSDTSSATSVTDKWWMTEPSILYMSR